MGAMRQNLIQAKPAETASDKKTNFETLQIMVF